jgi:hypothetical protein
MRISRKVLFGQTLLDIAAQELGDASRAFEIAVLNNKSITDALTAGEQYICPVPALKVRDVLPVFLNEGNIPASDDISGDIISKDEGVEYWGIENDFIIQ